MSQSAREGGADARRGPHAGPEPLPDLLELDLQALRTMDHPVLASVVADLRGRAGTPQEMLWGFTSAL
ncbi:MULTISPECIES: FxSxx-COOH cyclophane-containing RiPP peptide [Streptomycetaceae]|uniref:FxSxx-COOH cyclophane-containing RiPP peptide n=1 Tax=unclassified Streptomyces TaxID=2593676 RepID=UPI0033820479